MHWASTGSCMRRNYTRELLEISFNQVYIYVYVYIYIYIQVEIFWIVSSFQRLYITGLGSPINTRCTVPVYRYIRSRDWSLSNARYCTTFKYQNVISKSTYSIQRFQFYVIKGRHIHHGTLKKNSRSLAGHFSASLCSLVTCNKTGGTTLAWETSIGVRDYDLSISSYTSFKTQTGRHERKKWKQN